MKTKTFFLTTLILAFLLIYSTRINAQIARSDLDPVKLAPQWLGTWQTTVGKDTVEVMETKQYGKSYIANVSLVIKGKKSPSYIANYCFDSKDNSIKGFNLNAAGDYVTWIGIWTTEKKCITYGVQNFNPDTIYGKWEFLFESPTKIIGTSFNKDDVKTGEFIYNKVK